MTGKYFVLYTTYWSCGPPRLLYKRYRVIPGGWGVALTTHLHFSAEVKEERYIYSPSVSLWQFIGWSFPSFLLSFLMVISPNSCCAIKETRLSCSYLPVWTVRNEGLYFLHYSIVFRLCRPEETVRLPAIFADCRDGQTNGGEMPPASRGASPTRVLVAKRSALGNGHEPHCIQWGSSSGGPGAPAGYS